MAINPGTEYPGKIAAPTTEYPFGGAQNITAPGDGTGTPWIATNLNDIYGFHQALLKATGVVPTGAPEQVGASQYIQSVIALASGLAFNYADTGAADAYVLTPVTDLQFSPILFNGLTVKFTPTNDNTGASTLDYNGTIDAIVSKSTGNALIGGELVIGQEVTCIFNGVDWTLVQLSSLRSIDFGSVNGLTSATINIPPAVKKIDISLFGVVAQDDAHLIRLNDSTGLVTSGYTSRITSINNVVLVETDQPTNGFPASLLLAGGFIPTLNGVIKLRKHEFSTNQWLVSGIIHGSTSLFTMAGSLTLSNTLIAITLGTVLGATYSGGSISASYE